jgi:class 3 adenylate cyclase
MAREHINRKLAAILAADVVGYSRLMGSDEEGTLSALKQHRQTIFDPAVAAHNGRIVKLIGDGTIVEFGSGMDAVRCAVSIQRASGGPPDSPRQPIVLRIGINWRCHHRARRCLWRWRQHCRAARPWRARGIVSSIVNESISNH